MSKLDAYKGNVEVIDGLTPANGQDFALMQAHHIMVDESGKRLDEKLDELSESGGNGDSTGGTGGGGIIDVTELPTENIDEKSIYRLYTGTMYYNGYAQKIDVHVVEDTDNLSSGLPFADLTSGLFTNTYYDISDSTAKGYLTQALCDYAASKGVTITVGFYPLATLMTLLETSFEGVVTDLTDMTEGDTYYLYLEYKLYSYKEKWEALKGIGWEGEGKGAEIFNDPTNVASGEKAHVEGHRTTASGSFSHAEGASTVASAASSHAEGSSTTASGTFSHAEGLGTQARGIASHAEGDGTYANGQGTHAEGYKTISNRNYQHVQGKYNTEGDYAHIVGNGENDNARSNAHTLDWDGNAWFSGKVKVGGTGYDDPNAKELGAGGGGIIDVTELPTENIDEKSIYRTKQINAYCHLHAPSEGMSVSITDYLKTMGVQSVTYFTVDGLPTSFVPSDMENGIANIYLDISNRGYPYISLDGTTPIPAFDVLAEEGATDEMFRGSVQSETEMTTDGLYTILLPDTYAYQACKDGVWADFTRDTLIKKQFMSLSALALFCHSNPHLTLVKAVCEGLFATTIDEKTYSSTTITSIEKSTAGEATIILILSINYDKIMQVGFVINSGGMTMITQVNPLDGTGIKEGTTVNEGDLRGITAWFSTT